MYCKQQPSNQSNLFHVVREKKTVEQQHCEEEEEEKYEDEPIMVKPKRVKQRLPGVKLLRRLATPRTD